MRHFQGPGIVHAWSLISALMRNTFCIFIIWIYFQHSNDTELAENRQSVPLDGTETSLMVLAPPVIFLQVKIAHIEACGEKASWNQGTLSLFQVYKTH